MSNAEVFPVLIRVVFSFLAAFGAIAAWSKTRDAAWVFMVLGAIFFFVDSLYETLVIVGVVSYSLPVAEGFPLLESVLTGLPPLFLSLGFFAFLIDHRRY